MSVDYAEMMKGVESSAAVKGEAVKPVSTSDIPAEVKEVENQSEDNREKTAGEEKEKTEEEKAVEAAASADSPEEKEKKANRADRQYHKLLRERAEARAEAKLLREQLEQRNQQEQPNKQTQPNQSGDRPKREQYGTQEEYDAARDAYYDARIKQAEDSGRRQAVTERENQEIGKRLNDFKAKHPDYDKVLSEAEDDGLAVTTPVMTLIRDEVNPAAIIYHFAKNPEIADRINKMPDWKAAKEIGRLSLQLEGETVKNEKPVEKKVASSAPAPAAEISAGSKKKEKTPAEMTGEEAALYWKEKITGRKQ